MIDKCLNPGCTTKLQYLRAGSIVRAVYQEGILKHFWLCGECSTQYDFSFIPGRPATAVRCASPKRSLRFINSARAAA
jgi:hypothetical protein